MAVSRLSLVTPDLGKSRSNQALYSGTSFRRSTISGNLPFISAGVVIGPTAWSSSDLARPSQKKLLAQAAFRIVFALRASGVFADPIAPGTGTSKPKDGL